MENQEQHLAAPAQDVASLRRSLAAHSLSVGQRLFVMGLNYIPTLHLIGILCVGFWPGIGALWRVSAIFAVIYLLPAVVARIIVKAFPIRSQTLKLGSADFFKWWALANLQMLFCRLPILEELLRLIPVVYSAWLRLWGSRIGRLVFWSPGTQILDRSFVDVGDDVLFGAGVRVNPHVIVRNGQGENELILAPVKIGARAVVGGYSLLTAGSEIMPDEATHACLLLPPFSKWHNGKRIKP